MATTKNQILLVLLIFTVYSCTVYKKVDLPKQNGIQGYNGTNQTQIQEIAQANQNRLQVYDAEKKFIKNNDNLQWGLAMSGGGVRSATYNIGALKALYEMGLLNKIQIISSVSGGGYLSYGIYTNYFNHKQENKPFGYYTFDNAVFLQKVCYQQNMANFMPNLNITRAFFNTPRGAFNIYRKKIERAYGHNTPSSFKITSLNSEIEKGKAPYFIINSTLAASDQSDWLDRVVEFSPAYYGNPEIGFTTWNTNNTINWSEASTTSAAALKWKLLHKVPYSGKAISTDYLALSDGGHSENLAAIGLIRRGIKNIIIIDAEHNDNYSFDGYIILKHQLKKELNLDLNIKTIDSFLTKKESNDTIVLKTAVHKGTVSSIPLKAAANGVLDINIYYIKMAMSQDIAQQLTNQENIKQGKALNEQIKSETCTKYSKRGKCKYYSCSRLKDFENSHLKNLSRYWVASYATFLNNHKKWKRLGYTFPHTTTADQSFYRDQLAAFIGLGYLQTLELESVLD